MKTTITIMLILISRVVFAQTKEMYKKVGDSLMARGLYDEIIKYFDKESKKHPNNEYVLRWIGYAYIEKNNLDFGEKYLLRALAINSQCAPCYFNIGKIYVLRGNNKKALEYFDKAVNTDPNDALYYSYRAKLKEMIGDSFGALLDHNKAIEIAPNNSECFVQRGLYNANSGYQSLAISDFTRAIELSPKNYYPYFQRASIYYSQRKFNQALDDINKAIDLDSNQHSLYTGRGAIFDALQEYKKAVADYSMAISLNKKDFLPYLNRAISYYKLEDLDASCSDYAILKTLIEEGNITDQNIIKDINGAIQDFCNPSTPSYYYQRGVGYYNLKEYEKAIDIYSKGLTFFPVNAIMLSFKGNAYLALNEYEKAIDFYNLSLNHQENILTDIEANPRFAGASKEQITIIHKGFLASIYLSLSECKVNLGQLEGALADINIALELVPDIKDFNKEAFYNLRGFIYLMNGKYDKAIVDFNKSIQINENFPLAYVNRAIAKISLADKVKISSYSINANTSSQHMRVTWSFPNKSSLKKSEKNILSALSDCNKAIEIDKTLGFAYYIRGQIKQMLKHGDYCLDFFTAKRFGQTVEKELLRECEK